MKTSTFRCWPFALLLIVLAGAAPVVVAICARLLPEPPQNPEFLSVATLSGLLIGQLAGLRRARLSAFLVGPAIGFAAGFLDLRTLIWAYSTAGLPIHAAALIPVWSAVLGLWVSSFSGRWWSGVLRFSLICGCDLALRMAWNGWITLEALEALDARRWLIEALIYTPTAMLVVGLMRPGQPLAVSDSRPETAAGAPAIS